MEPLALEVPNTDGVYFVPAFVGLGAPWWDPRARAVMIGMTRGTTKAHLARAVIESMAFQTADVVQVMQEESGVTLKELRVDGGASVMNLLLQMQADVLGVNVRRPRIAETTALGAALLAGLKMGIWESLEHIEEIWKEEREAFPGPDKEDMAERRTIWRRAVKRSLDWATEC